MQQQFDWAKPSPLWQADGADLYQDDFFRPALLKFASDNFMEDFLAAAGAEKPDALAKAIAAPPEPGQTLRLFQPLHGRYYLICASLSCCLPGLPDREVRLADGEKISFVLRKLVANDQGGQEEHGWVAADPQHKGWWPLGSDTRQILQIKTNDLKFEEERLPLFSTQAGNQRPLCFGYIPVASRETYAVDPVVLSGDPSINPQAEEMAGSFSKDAIDAMARANPDIALRLSIYLMLDFWENLSHALPDVAEALTKTPIPQLSGGAGALITFLKNQGLGGTNLATTVGLVGSYRQQLNQPGGPTDEELIALFTPTTNYNLKGFTLNTDDFKAALIGALPDRQPPIEAPKLAPQAGDLFVLRCVYERPQCDPQQVQVSRASRQFELAPFFDPEAPVRPIRIGLPVDLSIAGLRKFKKGVSFMISKALRNKMDMVRGKEEKILDGEPPGAEGTLDLGMLCSFSIPIITLCAFILLLIIVVLLNLVFWWLPFFRICLPLNLKSK